jgi:hypothetical protein
LRPHALIAAEQIGKYIKNCEPRFQVSHSGVKRAIRRSRLDYSLLEQAKDRVLADHIDWNKVAEVRPFDPMKFANIIYPP